MPPLAVLVAAAEPVAEVGMELVAVVVAAVGGGSVALMGSVTSGLAVGQPAADRLAAETAVANETGSLVARHSVC